MHVGGAAGGKESAVAFRCESINHGPKMLVGDVLQVESQVRWPRDGEVRPDTPTVFSEGSDEQSNRTRHTMALIGPSAPGGGTARRAGVHLWRSGCS